MLHQSVEAVLGLPGSIQPGNYTSWLARFLGIYEPFETGLAQHDWTAFGLDLSPVRRSAAAASDLATLGMDRAILARLPRAAPPTLPGFAQALGARYVLEGATLGSRFILRDLQARIGLPIAGATQMFAGYGDQTGGMWKAFRLALDRFGEDQPHFHDDTIAGAHMAFAAFLAWFTPFRTDPDAGFAV